jgi:DNA-binding transcriptional regulator LsrR (DeoR family)
VKNIDTKDPRIQLLVVIATFLGNGSPTFRTNRDVARELGCSPNTVAKILQEAWDAGMFEVSIRFPEEVARVCQYERELKQKFGLREVLLVPGLPFTLTGTDKETLQAFHGMVTSSLASCAAAYLNRLVRERYGRVRIGVAWGRTIRAIVRALVHTPDLCEAPESRFVPIVGYTSTEDDPAGLEANVLAANFARIFKGRSSQFPAPAFVMPATKNVLCQDPQIRAARARAEQADIILTGLGPIFDCADPGAEMRLSTDPTMNEEMVKAAVRATAVGNLSGVLFNAAGEEVFGCRDVIGLDLDGFRRAARDPHRRVILVTGGDRRRIEPLRVALATGLVSEVITDTVIAGRLLEAPGFTTHPPPS